MEQLSEKLKSSSDAISENLTIEKISDPIAEFSGELLKLKEPAQNLRAEFSQLTGSSNSASKGLSITELTKKIGDEIRASALLVETNNRLSEVGKLNVNLLEDKQETLVEVNKQLTRLRNGTGKAAENYQLVADATIGVVDSSVELQTDLKAISNLIQNVSKDVAALVATTNSLGVSVSSSSKNLDALVQKSMVVTSEFSKTTTAVSDANSKISELPKSLENTLTALNVLNGTLNETSKSAQPIVQSLQNMTTPLDDATESTKSLQIALATLNKDIELISRILAQAALKN
jgi:chromosome segregation ATPase